MLFCTFLIPFQVGILQNWRRACHLQLGKERSFRAVCEASDLSPCSLVFFSWLLGTLSTLGAESRDLEQATRFLAPAVQSPFLHCVATPSCCWHQDCLKYSCNFHLMPTLHGTLIYSLPQVTTSLLWWLPLAGFPAIPVVPIYSSIGHKGHLGLCNATQKQKHAGTIFLSVKSHCVTSTRGILLKSQIEKV